MALLEDRRKPVDIYQKGTATEQAQDKMNTAVGNVFQSTANVAESSLGGAGLRKAGNILKKNVFSPISQPLAKSRQRNKNYFAAQAVNANRTAPENRQAIGEQFDGTSRVVGSSAPGIKPHLQNQAIGRGKVTNMFTTGNNKPTAASNQAIAADISQQNRFSAPPPHQVGVQPASPTSGQAIAQEIPSPERNAFSSKPKQQLEMMSSHAPSTAQNQFSPSHNYIRDEETGESVYEKDIAGNEPRMKFGVSNLGKFQKPGKPAQEVAQGAPPQQSSLNQFTNKAIDLFTQGQQGSINADRVINGSGQKRELFTKESHPNMGWKTRLALNKQILANEGAATTAQAATNRAAMGANATTQNAQLEAGTDRYGIDQQAATARIPKPVKKQRPQLFTNKEIDPITGEVSSTAYRLDDDGNPVRLIPQKFQSPPADRDMLVDGTVYQGPDGSTLGQWDAKLKKYRRMQLDQYGRAVPVR